MLNYLVSAQYDFTMRMFLSDWGKQLADRIRIVHYNDFLKAKVASPGSFIFSDLERISPNGLRQLQIRWQALSESKLCPHVLNQPLAVNRRLDLLNKLKKFGINDFNAYPITTGERVVPEKFPVFIREANDHMGPFGDLIRSQRDLDEKISYYAEIGKLDGTPIVVEFVDTSDASGRYRKYSAFRLGKCIIPTHVLSGTRWMVKESNLEPDQVEIDEELEFLENNPHEKELMEIFQIANIDYGRIDYGLADGRIQTFEINTNPLIMAPGAPKHPGRLRRKEVATEILLQAFREVIESPAQER